MLPVSCLPHSLQLTWSSLSILYTPSSLTRFFPGALERATYSFRSTNWIQIYGCMDVAQLETAIQLIIDCVGYKAVVTLVLTSSIWYGADTVTCVTTTNFAGRFLVTHSASTTRQFSSSSRLYFSLIFVSFWGKKTDFCLKNSGKNTQSSRIRVRTQTRNPNSGAFG